MTKSLPLYTQVSEDLREKIRNGEFEPGVQFTTEKKIKQEYGVSSITAVRVLEELEREGIIFKRRGMGSFVTDDAQDILNTVEDKSAEKIITNPCNDARLIPIVLPFDPNCGGMDECFRGINDSFRDRNCYVIVLNSERDIDEQEAKILKSQLNKHIDGIICYPQVDNKNLEIFNQFILKKIPIVMIDKCIENLPVGYVVSDNFDGAKQLCDYAIGQGHKKIAFYCDGNMHSLSTLRDRYLGYTTVLNEQGITVNLDFVKNRMKDTYEEEKAENKGKYIEYSDFMTNEILKLREAGVTAMLCQNDTVAIKAAKCCISCGINIPNDFLIMGFDNVRDIDKEQLRGKIITVEQDFYKIGYLAGELMLKALEDTNGSHSEKYVVPVKLVL